MDQEKAFRIICLELCAPGLATQDFDANPDDIASAFAQYQFLIAKSGPSLAGLIKITLQDERTGEQSVAVISATGNDLFLTVPLVTREFHSIGMEN